MRNIVIYRSSLCVTKELGELNFHPSIAKIYSPSSLVTHIEERYITIFRMQNNSQIIICENISRR